MSDHRSKPLDGPEGLRLLADWFDMKDAQGVLTARTVQTDLRRWADDMEKTERVVAAARYLAMKRHFSTFRSYAEWSLVDALAALDQLTTQEDYSGV